MNGVLSQIDYIVVSRRWWTHPVAIFPYHIYFPYLHPKYIIEKVMLSSRHNAHIASLACGVKTFSIVKKKKIPSLLPPLKIVNQYQEKLQRLVHSSKKYKSGCPHHINEQITYFTLEEVRYIWKMITDYPKFNKVLVSVAGAMLDILSFLGYISTTSHTWFI